MTSVADVRGFVHTAVSHRSPEELVDDLAPLLRAWLGRRDRVFVNLTRARAEALRTALGADADRVRWSDTYHWAPHPARRLRAIQELVEGEERHGSGQVRFVGQCAFPSDLPEVVAEWERFDAVLNDALADAPVTMVCTYDALTVPDGVAERVPCTHPMLGVDPVLPSREYLPPSDLLGLPTTLEPPPETATHEGGYVEPARARTMVREVLSRPGTADSAFLAQAVEDLSAIATELVTNALQAGARTIGMWCWHEDGELAVQIDDDGPGLCDGFAGYRRPASSGVGGRGLWIVRQLADLVDIASSSLGTSVRARIFESPRTPDR